MLARGIIRCRGARSGSVNLWRIIASLFVGLGENQAMIALSIMAMVSTSHRTLLNKIDLLPHLSYDLNEVRQNIKSVNPDMPVFEVSAATGKGFNEFIEFLSEKIDLKKSQVTV